MESSPPGAAGSSTIRELFVIHVVTGMVSVETCVALTTLLLVFRFLLDFLGPSYTDRSLLASAVPAIEVLNYSMVQYTMGLMQLSAEAGNDYFQVWGVLLVTLQYSVKVGQPYARQTSLLDFMSSLWSANLLYVQATDPLKNPLWVMWGLNAARFISYFTSTDKAEAIHNDNLRLSADYMSYEHKLPPLVGGGTADDDDADADADDIPLPGGLCKGRKGSLFTMDSYKYLVHGETQVLKDLQKTKTRRRYGIRLDPGAHEKLITLHKVWSLDGGQSGLLGDTADQGDRLKDVCLSFALYKLQRRRFYDLPVHEARLLPRQELDQQAGNKMRRLVSEYILHDAERAFRVVATEVSFLQDFFYSKHATTFADGFPAKNLVLSLLLLAATGYTAYPVRHIPETMDKAATGYTAYPDRNRITHGVFITRLMIALIVVKELAEVHMYVFSQWAKVLALCSYVTHRCLRRHSLLEGAMRALLHVMTRDRWDEKILQHNLLIATRALEQPGRLFTTWNLGSIKMEACTKEAIFVSVKRLLADNDKMSPHRRSSLMAGSSYLSNAFGAPDQPLYRQLLWTLELEADTHRIVVWHIATALCEIDLASDTAVALRPFFMRPRPFVKKKPAKAITSELGDHGSSSSSAAASSSSATTTTRTTTKHGDNGAPWWEHYATAASLSNYCAYLVVQELVPDNSLVSVKVLDEVRREIIQLVTMDGSIGLFRSMRDIFNSLMHAGTTTANMMPHEQQVHAQGRPPADEEAPPMATPPVTETETVINPPNITNTLTSKGAKLAKQLMVEYKEDKAGLWKKLAEFWTEFLLHLAASTRASKHKTGLAGRRELITHIWALLSHAGYVSWTNHGHTPTDPADRGVFQFANQP